MQTRCRAWHRAAMPNPARLRADARRFRARAKALMDRANIQAHLLLSRAEACDFAADELERLQGRNGHGTIGAMDTAKSRTRKGTDGPPLTSKGPLATAARQLGCSLAALARKLGESEGSVRSWDFRGAMPKHVADKLQKLVEADAR